MDYFTVVSELLLVGLKLWERKNKNKYFEELRNLERGRHSEEAKPLEERDQAMLDNIDYELLLLSRKFVSATKDGGSNSSVES
jgi:hypothetical protein